MWLAAQRRSLTDMRLLTGSVSTAYILQAIARQVELRAAEQCGQPAPRAADEADPRLSAARLP